MTWEAVIILAIILIGAIYFYRRNRTKKEAGDILKMVGPLWGRFGPYKNGADSANTFYYCVWATQGKKFVDELEKSNAFKGHAEGYDRKTAEWEQVQKQATELPIDDLEKKQRLVVALFELDQLKREGNPKDWGIYLATGYVATLPGNEAGKKLLSIMNNLAETDKNIEIKTANLMEDYVVYTGNEIDQNIATGLLIEVCLNYALENPDLDISKDMLMLKDEMIEQHSSNHPKQ